MTILVVIGLLVALILVGVPIGYSMAVAGALGLWLHGGQDAAMGILSTSPYRQSASWLLVTLPMFILMAEFMTASGMAKRLFSTTYLWFRAVPGSLAVATVFSSAMFGAISGSSSAATATMAKTAIPEMKRFGYDNRLSLGAVASSGSLAMLIPPSVVLIIYGILTETSIGQLFLAGIVPGVLTALLYAAVVMVWVKARPAIAPSKAIEPVPGRVGVSAVAFSAGHERQNDDPTAITWTDRFRSLGSVLPIVVLFGLVMGGIYTGLATVTEAASVGAGGALLIAVVTRTIDGRGFLRALTNSVKTTAMIFTIIIGAHIFGYFLTLTRTTFEFVNFVSELSVPRWQILAVFLVMYLLLGFVMDQLAILVLTVPLVFPVIVELGYNPVWFGILIIKTVEIGLATPPLGLNVFIGSSISGISLSDGFRGVSRFVLSDLVLLVILAMFPAIVLVLV